MTHINEVDRQLKAIGVEIRFWGRAEVEELAHILMPGEVIKQCVNGRYEGGFALLCATDQRILLVDKKLMYLSVEDIRYDMVAEVDFHGRLLDSTINIITPSKNLLFTGFKQKPLRAMTTYVQNRVMEFRQQHMMQDMPQTQMPQQQMMQPQMAQVQQPMQQQFQQPAQPVMDNVSLQYQSAGSVVPFAGRISKQVQPIQFNASNPYTKVPLMMRRRIGRFS